MHTTSSPLRKTSCIRVLGKWLMMLAAMSMALAAQAQEPRPIAWTSQWDEAMQRAQAEKLPVLLLFTTSWDLRNKTMDSGVLSDPKVCEESLHWVCIRINGEENTELSSKYQIRIYPCFILLDDVGKEMDRFGTLLNPDNLAGRLRLNRKLHDNTLALEVDRNNPFLLCQRADLLRDTPKSAECLELYRKAISLDIEQRTGAKAEAFYLEILTDMLATPEQMAMRLEKLEQFYPQFKRLDEALFIRAMLARQTDNQPQMRALLEQYLERFPQGDQASLARGFLEEKPVQNPINHIQ